MLICFWRTEISENEALWSSYSEDQENCEKWWATEEKDWENLWENEEENKIRKENQEYKIWRSRIIITESQAKDKKSVYNFHEICSAIYYFFSQKLDYSWFWCHYSCIQQSLMILELQKDFIRRLSSCSKLRNFNSEIWKHDFIIEKWQSSLFQESNFLYWFYHQSHLI